MYCGICLREINGSNLFKKPDPDPTRYNYVPDFFLSLFDETNHKIKKGYYEGIWTLVVHAKPGSDQSNNRI